MWTILLNGIEKIWRNYLIKFNYDKLNEALGWCGCYDDQIFIDFEKILNFLISCKNNKDYDTYYTKIAKELSLSENYIQIILYELDRIGLTTHGGSVRGSWPKDLENNIKLNELTREEVEDK